ncbi:UNVERIFIED_ORG: DUF4184 family protein [Bacillus sp. AZ43]
MPFTPSHAAAVLPFLRGPLPASALVIGSVTPDLPFYLPGGFPWPTHTAWAVVTTDLLLGFAAWAVWHGLLAGPAFAAAPARLRGRMRAAPPGLLPRVSSPARLALTALALVLGAATHVLWDEFTHPRRLGTDLFPTLGETWGLLPGYRWLQYLSSVLGGLLLLGWLVRWWLRTPARPTGRSGTAWAWLLLAAVGTVVGGAAALSSGSIGAAIFDGATWGGGAALAVAALLAAAWHVRHRGR